MIGRLILHALTRFARHAGFQGMDDETHAAWLADIEAEGARLHAAR